MFIPFIPPVNSMAVIKGREVNSIRQLTEKEANLILDKGEEIKYSQEYIKGGFSLDFNHEGKKYRLYFDHETYFTGVGEEISS